MALGRRGGLLRPMHAPLVTPLAREEVLGYNRVSVAHSETELGVQHRCC